MLRAIVEVVVLLGAVAVTAIVSFAAGILWLAKPFMDILTNNPRKTQPHRAPVKYKHDADYMAKEGNA